MRQPRIHRERHVRRDHILLERGRDDVRHLLAAIRSRRAQRAPARFDELVVGLLEPFWRPHAAVVVPRAAFEVARLVEREQHLRDEPPAVADVVQVDQLANIGQREADSLPAQDPRQPRAVAVRIDALRAATLRRDQPLILVEPQRACGNAEFGRQVGNREIVARWQRLDRRVGRHTGHAATIRRITLTSKAAHRYWPLPHSIPPRPSRNAAASDGESLSRSTLSPASEARFEQAFRQPSGSAPGTEIRSPSYLASNAQPGALVSSTWSVSPARVASPVPLQKKSSP